MFFASFVVVVVVVGVGVGVGEKTLSDSVHAWTRNTLCVRSFFVSWSRLLIIERSGIVHCA